MVSKIIFATDAGQLLHVVFHSHSAKEGRKMLRSRRTCIESKFVIGLYFVTVEAVVGVM